MRRWLFAVVACLTLILSGPRTVADGGEGPHFAADRPMDIEHIRLDLHVDLPKKRVDGRATITGTALRPPSAIQLDAVGFETRGATLQLGDNSPGKADCHNDGQRIELPLPDTLPAGGRFQATIDYRVTDPPDGLSFFAPSE